MTASRGRGFASGPGVFRREPPIVESSLVRAGKGHGVKRFGWAAGLGAALALAGCYGGGDATAGLGAQPQLAPGVARAAPDLSEAEAAIRAGLGIPPEAPRVIILSQSSHLDLNWLKTFEHYYQDRVRGVFDRALALLDANPRYYYSIAEIDYLRRWWEDRPEAHERLRAHAQSGRLRIVGGGISSPDTVLPSGEALLRDWYEGFDWVEQHLGVRPVSAWQPDSFGHAPSVPKILEHLGVRYVGFARVDPTSILTPAQARGDPGAPPLREGSTGRLLRDLGASDFRWRGQDGSEVLGHWMALGYGQGDSIDLLLLDDPAIFVSLGTEHEYTPLYRPEPFFVNPKIQLYIDTQSPMARSPYLFVPIGLDFMHPRERLLDYVDNWNRMEYPTTGVWAVAATFDHYMALLEACGAPIPTLELDINPLWTGFYSTRPTIKEGHARGALGLQGAEAFSTLAATVGFETPQGALDLAWNRVARLNHHDGIPGTSTNAVADADQIPDARLAVETAESALAGVGAWLAARVDTAALPGSEAALVVMNPLGFARSGFASARVALPPGAFTSLEVVDAGGAPALSQLLEAARAPDGTLLAATVGLLAEDVPAYGLKSFAVRGAPGAPLAAPEGATVALYAGEEGTESPLAATRAVLANGVVRAELSKARGWRLTSLVDLRRGEEMLAGVGADVIHYNDKGGPYRIGEEAFPGTFYARSRASDVKDGLLQVIEAGPARVRVRAVTLRGVPITGDVMLEAGSPRVEFVTTTSAPINASVAIRFETALPDGENRMGVPYGTVSRSTTPIFHPTYWPSPTGVDWTTAASPGLRFAAVGAKGWSTAPTGVVEMLGTRSAFHEILGPPMSDTTPRPLYYSVAPREAGDALSGGKDDSESLAQPLRAFATGVHAGPLPTALSVASSEDPLVRVEAVKPARRTAGLAVRLYALEPGMRRVGVALGPGVAPEDAGSVYAVDGHEKRPVWAATLERFPDGTARFEATLDRQIATFLVAP